MSLFVPAYTPSWLLSRLHADGHQKREVRSPRRISCSVAAALGRLRLQRTTTPSRCRAPKTERHVELDQKLGFEIEHGLLGAFSVSI